MLSSVLALHVLAAAAALVLPLPAFLISLAGVAASAVAFLRQARRPLTLHCERGLVLARFDEGSTAGPYRVYLVPLLGGLLLILHIPGARGWRYWCVARGDFAEEDYGALVLAANWPARQVGAGLK